jgi:hypothetical protein
MKTRTGCWLAALALLLAASGCGPPRLVKVTGRLTHKGQPVPSTYVTFAPEDGSRPSRGLTEANGNFKLRNTHQDEGAVLGRHTVFLTYKPVGEEESGKSPPAADKSLQKVIARHSDPSASDLHVEVTQNGQHVEIELP